MSGGKYVVMEVLGVSIASYYDLGIPEPRYLKHFDPEARNGHGLMLTTFNRSDAMRFDNISDALALWQTQGKAVPLRDDGEPNRPLSAFTVEFRKVG